MIMKNQNKQNSTVFKSPRVGTLGTLDTMTRNEFRFLPEKERTCLLEQARAEKTLIDTLSAKDETVKKQLQEGYGISVTASCVSKSKEGQKRTYFAQKIEGISKTGLSFTYWENGVDSPPKRWSCIGNGHIARNSGQSLRYDTLWTYDRKISIKIAIPGINGGKDILVESKNYVWKEEIDRIISAPWEQRHNRVEKDTIRPMTFEM